MWSIAACFLSGPNLHNQHFLFKNQEMDYIFINLIDLKLMQYQSKLLQIVLLMLQNIMGNEYYSDFLRYFVFSLFHKGQ